MSASQNSVPMLARVFNQGAMGWKLGNGTETEKVALSETDTPSSPLSVHCIISSLKEHNNEHNIPLHKCVQKAPKYQKH